MKEHLIALIGSVLLFTAANAHGQTLNLVTEPLPSNLFAAGVGVNAGQNKAGVSAICHAVEGLNYVCLESKFSGSTTANTVEYKRVLFARGGFVLAGNVNAGVATGADSGTGGAFAAGGAVLVNLGRFRFPKDYWFGVSGAWDKRNVDSLVESVKAGKVTTALKPFGAAGTYYLFVGRSW